MAEHVQPAVSAYFPRADEVPFVASKDSISPIPSEIGPVSDTISCALPILAYEEDLHNAIWPQQSSSDAIVEAPPRPPNFKDPYLFPTLTKNERLRLTALWYYTKATLESPDLLLQLQKKAELIQLITGFEFCIVGLLDNAVFRRVAASGMPLAMIPRRESTCSHTINQPLGSVLAVPDMDNDWRFANSPHVRGNGLRSYAGTALVCHTPDGDVALGSLCVASHVPNQTLSSTQQAALVQFAEMIVEDFDTNMRIARQRERKRMDELIIEFENHDNGDNIEEAVILMVKRVYPEAVVTMQTPRRDEIHLRGHDPVSYNEFSTGLWEDSSLIESLISSDNQTVLRSTATIRAIVGRVGTPPDFSFLVVDSLQAELVFDDIDAYFIDRCSKVFHTAIQKRFLDEALKAKEVFLRGITHNLRTPIHGILGSSELLAEELDSQYSPEFSISRSEDPRPNSRAQPLSTNEAQLSLPSSPGAPPPPPLSDNGTAPSRQSTTDRSAFGDRIKRIPLNKSKSRQLLDTINESGRELMSTVNNIIKLNRWSEISSTSRSRVAACDLRHLEVGVMQRLNYTVSKEEYSQACVIFNAQYAFEDRLVAVDCDLVQECLALLICNAIQSCPKGLISITITVSADVLQFDIVDEGIGIDEKDHNRIFQLYEKADETSRGAGLGLTLASKMAIVMHGSVSLVSSTLRKGSHFRLSFPRPEIVSKAQDSIVDTIKVTYVPRPFRVVPSTTTTDNTLVTKFVDHIVQRGLKPVPSEEDTKDNADVINIIQYTQDAEVLQKRSCEVSRVQVQICLVPTEEAAQILRKEMPNMSFECFSGPFFSSRFDEILQRVDRFCTERHTLPLLTDLNIGEVPPSALEDLSPPRSPVAPTQTFSDPMALLVDDNPINLTIFRMFCRKRNIPTVEAINGQLAVDLFCTPRNQPINLIFMDLQMPVCDGIEAVRRIRIIEAEEDRPPAIIFIVTGQDSPNDRLSAVEAGADDFFVKPVSIKVLDGAVKRFFRSMP